MKAIFCMSAAAAFMLAGCGGTETANTVEANAAAGNETAPAGQALLDSSGNQSDTGNVDSGSGGDGEAVTLNAAYVTGQWTDDGNCKGAITFHRDGRFSTAEGGTGLWVLDGDRLTLQGQATASLRIVPIDRDTMNVINADGSLGRSTRC